jgi:paraquat-inducible protein B
VGCGAIEAGMSGEAAPERPRTEAAVRRSRWPGWIWAIPIAALLVVGWWVFRSLMSGGEDVTISFDDAHGLKEGSNTSVLLRGMKVGKVSSLKLAKDGSAVEVEVHLDDSATPFLKSGTLFWLRGATPSFSDLSTLGSVLSGPTIVMEPGPGEPVKRFRGLAYQPVISGAHGPPRIYEVSLSGGSIGALKRGEPVKLRGFTVGEVREVGFHYDAASGALATPVTLALYPSLFPIEGAGTSDGGPALTAAIDRLIEEGLRARLERDPPLVGNPQVTLEIAPDSTGAAPAVVDGVKQIPAAPGGGVNSIVERVNKLPIDKIAQNLLDTTRHVDQLVSSPQLGDAVAELDATLKQIDETTRRAGPKIATLVESLRKTAAQLQQTARSANTVLGGTPGQNALPETMREVTDAARSLRELADFLDRHPEALVEGRTGQ